MPPTHAPADASDESDASSTTESPPVVASASGAVAAPAMTPAANVNPSPSADVAPADDAGADPSTDPELESEAVTVNVVLPDARKEDDTIVFPLLPTDCVQDIRHVGAEYPQAYIHTALYFEFDGERCESANPAV